MVFLPTIVFGLIVFLASSIRLWQMRKGGQLIVSRVTKVFFRDGAWYFLGVFVVHIVRDLTASTRLLTHTNSTTFHSDESLFGDPTGTHLWSSTTYHNRDTFLVGVQDGPLAARYRGFHAPPYNPSIAANTIFLGQQLHSHTKQTNITLLFSFSGGSRRPRDGKTCCEFL